MPGGDIVLIVGVGRSGTSALTRVLSLSGCTLPQAVLGAMQINPRGSWEPVEIWRLNHDLMFRHGTEYCDPSMRLQEGMLDDCEKQSYIARIVEFLNSFPRESLPLIKQPDITEVMDLWIQAAHSCGLCLKIVIAIRHPQEVFQSIRIANQSGGTTSLELASAFWLKRNLLAEHFSRNFPRVFVEYSNLMENWRVEIARVSTALSIGLNPDHAAIESFLSADLHRQRYSGPVTETFGNSWMSRVYAILSAAARDCDVDLATMDEILDAYRLNERTFRIAGDEFRAMFASIDSQQIRDAVAHAPVLTSASGCM